ncbi:MAG: hemolysin family protein, partial [Thalassolituus sp.]
MSDMLAIALLIVASAAFAMSEIGIAAARTIKLRVMAGEGDRKAQDVLDLQQNPGAFFAMIQIALNAISILGGIIGEQALTPYIKEALAVVYQGNALDEISFALSFFSITALFILFADLLPKRIAVILPEATAVRMVTPMRWVTFMVMPLVFFFNGVTNIVLRLLNLPTEREEQVTTEDIVAMMDAGAEDGSLQKQEYDLIGNVFDLDTAMISGVMTPRDQIVYFDLEEDATSISEKVVDHPHNDFLVCDGTLDKIRGSVESKTILRLVLRGEMTGLQMLNYNPDVLYLPETLTLSEGLNAFKTAMQPFAVVVNEYATVVGLITVKDLLSGFIGQLITHEDDQQIILRDDNSWLMDGMTPIGDVMKALDINEFPDRNQYETIAGFMIYQLKRLPRKTDFCIHGGFKFEVLDLEGVR